MLLLSLSLSLPWPQQIVLKYLTPGIKDTYCKSIYPIDSKLKVPGFWI